MDNCIICLKYNADTFSRIDTESSEWNECNIRRVIEKHLWWWHLKKPSNDSVQWMCRQCWQELSTFHKFYIEVEKEHKQYQLMMMPIIKSDDPEELLIVKNEFKIPDNSPILIEEIVVSPSEKRKRRRKNKSFENIQIDELPEVKVKSEDDLHFSDNTKSPEKVYEQPIQSMENNGINDVMTTDSIDDMWEPDVDIDNYQSTDDDEENVLDSITNGNSLEESTPKHKPKTKKVSTRKKNSATKVTKERKIKNESSKRTQTSKQNDEVLAEYKFELVCSLCKIILSNFYKLKYHFRNEHNEAGYAMCCNRKFYKRGLLADHIRVHQDPNYFKCPECDKILANRTNYDNHLEYHKELKEPREANLNCDKCDKSFSKKASYDRHQLLHMPEEDRKFQCTDCEKKFATIYLCKQHIAFTHTNKYAKICDICGKLLRDKFSFERHMDEHNGAPPPKIPCDVCGAELTNKYLLNRHKKKLHTEANLQEQICPYCSKVSPNMSSHRHHIQYSHTLERKHACHMCEKKFKRPQELREHLSVHTGEALYTCPHCPRTFISNGNMHKHRKQAHRKEWEEGRLKKLTTQQLNMETLANQDGLNSTHTPQDESVNLQQSFPENLTMENEINF